MRHGDSGPSNYKWLLGSHINRVLEFVSAPKKGDELAKSVDLALIALQELASPHTHADPDYRADVEKIRKQGVRDPTKRRLRQLGAIVRSLHRSGQLGDKRPPRGDATDFFSEDLDDDPDQDGPDDQDDGEFEDDLLST